MLFYKNKLFIIKMTQTKLSTTCFWARCDLCVNILLTLITTALFITALVFFITSIAKLQDHIDYKNTNCLVLCLNTSNNLINMYLQLDVNSMIYNKKMLYYQSNLCGTVVDCNYHDNPANTLTLGHKSSDNKTQSFWYGISIIFIFILIIIISVFWFWACKQMDKAGASPDNYF